MVNARLVINIPEQFKAPTVANLITVSLEKKSLRKMGHVNVVHPIQSLSMMIKLVRLPYAMKWRPLSLMVLAKNVLNILVHKTMARVVHLTIVFLEKKS